MVGRACRRFPTLLAALLLAAPARAELRVEVEGGTRGLVAGAPRILQLVDPDAPPQGCWQRWRDYWTPPWRWRISEAAREQQGGTGGLIQDLGAGRFRYDPPRTRAPRTLRLQVASRRDPDLTAEVTVQVVPPAPLELPALGPDLVNLILSYCPEAAHAPLAAPLPFLDPATGLRSRPGARVQELRLRPLGPDRLDLAWRNRLHQGEILAGYGLRVRLCWPPLPAAGQLLSWRNGSHGGGADTTRLDITGQAGQEVAFTAPVSSCTLEALTADAGGGWTSRLFEAPVTVRGLLPVAGNAVAEPALLPQEGRGVSARLVEPCGLALVNRGRCACGHRDPLLVVAEPKAHVLLGVDCETGARTLWGRPGCPGDRDGGAAEATFHGPTWVACSAPWAWPEPEPLWHPRRTGSFVVADSGNHLIRMVDPAGAVTTLAGARGLGPGHRDHADPLQARFSHPQGLAMDLAGNVFVADQGNCVIRRIGPGGVTTLAGSPGQPGADDGLGEKARFFRLKGLAWDHAIGCLYAADGHAIREISPEGRVRTLLGSVARSGFQDLDQRPADPSSAPCCDDPRGLAAGAGHVFFADAGNHAIRAWSRGEGSLRTVAGDPGRPELGWGLLRDGLTEFPATGYGSLLAPAGLVLDDRQSGSEALFVSSGPCLAQLPGLIQPARSRPRVQVRRLEPLRVGEAYRVAFRVPNERHAPGRSARFDFEYTVEFLDPDGGAVGPPVRGRGAFTAIHEVPGRPFTQEGTGKVRVRCVTLDGCSGGAERLVPVR